MNRIRRTLIALAAVFACYFAYRFTVVPAVEPPRRANSKGPIAADSVQITPSAQRQYLSTVFQPGDWELEQATILEMDTAVLMIRDYRNLPDGHVELKPCTLVFFPQGNFSQAERWRQAIILRAPQGAILKFDAPIELASGKVGNWQEAELPGPITIHSDHKLPGPDDDLNIFARDLKMAGTALASPHDVRFQLGKNSGAGKGLVVELIPSPQGGAGSRQLPMSGIKAIEITKAVAMQVDIPAKTLGATLGGVSGGSSPATAEPGLAQSEAAPAGRAGPSEMGQTLDIRCRGPFRFDHTAGQISFRDQVEVDHPLPGNQGETLRQVDLLTIFLESNTPAAGPPSESLQHKLGISKLAARKIVAQGSPFLLRVPSRGLTLEGQQLTHLPMEGQLEITSQTEVALKQGSWEMYSPHIQFLMAVAGKREASECLAQGPGRLLAPLPGSGKLPPGSPAKPPIRPAGTRSSEQNSAGTLVAAWQQQLHMRPQDDQQLLTLSGQASLKLTGGDDSIQSETIHVWLHQQPQPLSSGLANGQHASSIPAGLAGGSTAKLVPHTIQALDQVVFTGSKLRGNLDELEVFLQFHEPDPAGRFAPTDGNLAQDPAVDQRDHHPADSDQGATISGASASRGPAPGPGLPGITDSAPGSPPSQPFEVTGGKLQMELEIAGQEVLVTHFSLIGQAVQENGRLVRQPAKLSGVQPARANAAPGSLKPMSLAGDQIEGTRINMPDGRMSARGAPAIMEMEGLTLRSAYMELDRAKNLLSVPGPMSCQAMMDRDLDGKPLSEPQPMRVTCQQRMTFDGRRVLFLGDVIAQGTGPVVQADQMEALLRQPVSFAKPDRMAKTELKELVFDGRVKIDHVSMAAGERTGKQHVELQRLVLHAQTGELVGTGPGLMTAVQWDNGNSLAQLGPRPGRGRSGPDSPGGATANAGRPQSPGAAEPKLIALGIRFVEGLQGRQGPLDQKQVTFHGDIWTTVGPAPDWDYAINADRLKKDEYLMRSEEMTLTQTQPRGVAQPVVELMATDNVTAEGTDFFAQAARLSYSQYNDLLILEGDGWADAKLFRRSGATNPRPTAEAKKILYWPKQDQIRVEEVGNLNVSGGR